jgi:shikimate dehydrogenase
VNVLGSTRVLGVFGHPIEHSLSPVMQNAALRALNLDLIYVPFHVVPDKLEGAVEAVRALDLAGVNVTIPHKERVMSFLDRIGEEARLIGSVNTVVNEDGRLLGESTDGMGFLRSIEAEWGGIDGGKAVILGAGGSAKAVAFALAGAGCDVVIANRTRTRAEELSNALNAVVGEGRSRAVGLEREVLAEAVREADLLVNATSVGMYPDTDSIPVEAELLHSGLSVYDLIYNPSETRLVAAARARGSRAMTGIKMLVHQGALSLQMWTGREAPVDVMENAVMDRLFGERI